MRGQGARRGSANHRRRRAGAESIRIQAEAEGRRAAEQAIDQVVEQRLDEQLIPLKTALATVLDDLQSARHEWLAHWEEQAVHLALSIAERVIRRELRADPEIPVELVREALQLAAGSARLRLLMHPTDVAALGGPLQKLLDELAPLDSIALVPDTAISRGGCRVETENGVVDQQFEAQLARIAEELA